MPNTDKPLDLLGPCTVTFNAVDVGKTEGSVQFSHQTSQMEIHNDQAGETPVDRVEMGGQLSVVVPLTQASYAQLEAVIQGAVGVHNSSGDKTDVSNVPGKSHYASAQKLILKAIKAGVASADTDDWLTIPKAFPSASPELSFGNDGQRIFNVTFFGYPDETSGLLYTMGDETAA